MGTRWMWPRPLVVGGGSQHLAMASCLVGEGDSRVTPQASPDRHLGFEDSLPGQGGYDEEGKCSL